MKTPDLDAFWPAVDALADALGEDVDTLIEIHLFGQGEVSVKKRASLDGIGPATVTTAYRIRRVRS